MGRKNSGPATIGFGKKSDFTKNTQHVPEGSKYTMPSLFESNSKIKKGMSIGTSREVAMV